MRLRAEARMLLPSSNTRFVFRRAICLNCIEFNWWLLQSLLELTLNSFFVDCFLNLYIADAAVINWITILSVWAFVLLQQLYDGAISFSPVGLDELISHFCLFLFWFNLLGVKFWNWESAVYDIFFLITEALWSSSCAKTIVGLCCKNRFIDPLNPFLLLS